MRLKIKVVKIKGNCPVYNEGDEFHIEDGYKLNSKITLCMHSLASIMPYYIPLSRGISSQELGLAKFGSRDEVASPLPARTQHASYCELVTRVYISDRTVRYGHITKQGNCWLRWIYIEASHFARRKSYRFGSLYERVLRRSGSKEKAMVAVAREMAVVSYYLIADR